MLPPFRIRNLQRPPTPPNRHAGSSPRTSGSFDAIVRITSPEYDETVIRHPEASLRYLDEDDEDIVTVGSSLELRDRLREPISKLSTTANRAELGRDRPWRDVILRPSSPSSEVHTFEIDRRGDSVEIWQEIEKRNRAGISFYQSDEPMSEATVKEELSHSTDLPPFQVPGVFCQPKLSDALDNDVSKSLNSNGSHPVSEDMTITTEGKRQAQAAGAKLRARHMKPTTSTEIENRWATYNGVRAESSNMQHQPLLQAFKDELAKLPKATYEPTKSGTNAENLVSADPISQAPSEPPLVGTSNTSPGLDLADLVMQTTKSLMEGYKSITSEFHNEARPPRDDGQPPSHPASAIIDSGLRNIFRGLEQGVQTVARSMEEVSLAARHAAEKTRTMDVQGLEAIVKHLQGAEENTNFGGSQQPASDLSSNANSCSASSDEPSQDTSQASFIILLNWVPKSATPQDVKSFVQKFSNSDCIEMNSINSTPPNGSRSSVASCTIRTEDEAWNLYRHMSDGTWNGKPLELALYSFTKEGFRLRAKNWTNEGSSLLATLVPCSSDQKQVPKIIQDYRNHLQNQKYNQMGPFERRQMKRLSHSNVNGTRSTQTDHHLNAPPSICKQNAPDCQSQKKQIVQPQPESKAASTVQSQPSLSQVGDLGANTEMSTEMNPMCALRSNSTIDAVNNHQQESKKTRFLRRRRSNWRPESMSSSSQPELTNETRLPRHSRSTNALLQSSPGQNPPFPPLPTMEPLIPSVQCSFKSNKEGTSNRRPISQSTISSWPSMQPLREDAWTEPNGVVFSKEIDQVLARYPVHASKICVTEIRHKLDQTCNFEELCKLLRSKGISNSDAVFMAQGMLSAYNVSYPKLSPVERKALKPAGVTEPAHEKIQVQSHNPLSSSNNSCEESSGEFFKRMTGRSEPRRKGLSNAAPNIGSSTSAAARLPGPFDPLADETASAFPRHMRDGVRRTATSASLNSRFRASARRPYSEAFSGNGRMGWDSFLKGANEMSKEGHFTPNVDDLETLMRNELFSGGSDSSFSSTKAYPGVGVKGTELDSHAKGVGVPIRNPAPANSPATDMVKDCVRQLRNLGFSSGDVSDDEQRLSIYAEAANGDLGDAIDLLEEEAKAWEERAHMDKA